MINHIQVYIECGEKTAEARFYGDEARARFHADWKRKAIALENPENRVFANEAFDAAYSTMSKNLRGLK